MNVWTQTCTAVLENSACASTSLVTTHVNARMDCTTKTTLAKVRHNGYIVFPVKDNISGAVPSSLNQKFTAISSRTHANVNEPIKTGMSQSEQARVWWWWRWWWWGGGGGGGGGGSVFVYNQNTCNQPI